jgi:hypothetical protein
VPWMPEVFTAPIADVWRAQVAARANDAVPYYEGMMAEYTHRGAEGLRTFYAHLFANGGGIPLEHCTLTDDGTRCAIEYNCVRWGATDIPPQAGVAVYECASSGLLSAARIYDDVEPPTVRICNN